MPRDPLQPERCAELLAALAAPERLKIVRLLAGGPHNVSQITAALAIPPLNISHHLTVLKHARLIAGRKDGRFVLDLACCQLVLPPAGPARRPKRGGC